MQLIKNNIGRIQSDRNFFETRLGPKQRRHRKIDVEDKKTKIQEIKGYNLFNGAKL